MATTYRTSRFRRWFDRTMLAVVRRGISPAGIAALTVAGRSSGVPHTVPITPLRRGARLYLVGPYGETAWVRNLRAAGEGTLARGNASARIRASEVDAAEAAPVLKEYLARVPVVREHFPIGPDAPVAQFEAIAGRYPVFRVVRA